MNTRIETKTYTDKDGNEKSYTIPADLVRYAKRVATNARDWAFKESGIRSEALLDGILYAVEAMGCDADEMDALYDTINAILAGGEVK